MQGEIAQVDHQLASFEHDIDVSKRVVAMTTDDLSQLKTLVARAETSAKETSRPVAIRFATAEEAARLPLRKEPVRGGTLRLIDVEGFDLSACGGTHVARTGGIGIIAIASWERFKGGQRIEFLCGGRALSAGYFPSLPVAGSSASSPGWSVSTSTP